MGGRLTAILWIALLAALLGCSQPPAGPPVEYPAGWPLPSLKAPRGSTAVNVRIPGIWGGANAVAGAAAGVESGGGWTTYYVGFRSSRGWEADEEQFCGRMERMGYTVLHKHRDSSAYESADGRTQAMLYSFDEYHSRPEEDCVLLIRQRSD